MASELIHAVDALLPQTQCGLCGHEAGCLPYAQSMVAHGEAANKCIPGGQPVADALAKLLERQPLAATESKWAIDARTGRPQEVRAVIVEDECIGCTKCIAACPVDAIVGSGKLMHTVFTELCTGCELCLPPCPVDCIVLVPYKRKLNDAQRQAEQKNLRIRYQAHLARLADQLSNETNQAPVVNALQARITQQAHGDVKTLDSEQAKRAIEAAKLRTQIKKLKKQLAARTNPKKVVQLAELEAALKKLENG